MKKRSLITGLRKHLAALVLSAATPLMALADSPFPVVVELYTSQGCSSCPPADRLLEELAKRHDVIPLALHVDYWDYLGWKDTMGSPEHTKRQKAYAHVAGARSIYTPQMIVGGKTHVIGHKPMQLADAISAASAALPGVELSLTRRGNVLEVSAKPEPGLPRDLIVQLFRYNPSYDVSIRRGENAGRVITYVNAVTHMEQIGTWNGRSNLRLRESVSGTEPLVVVIQERGPGKIVAAARVN